MESAILVVAIPALDRRRNAMAAPTVFISYSHDSPAHKAWVLRLASDLQSNGVEVTLDQWDLRLGQDLSMFMQRGISASDRVLLVCTETYVEKAEAGTGGVGYERLIVTAEVVASIDTRKFVPIVRDNLRPIKVPAFLGPRLYADFSDDAQYNAQLETLLRDLLNNPMAAKPPLGSSPFSGEAAPPSVPARAVGSTGLTGSGIRLLDEGWFEGEADRAKNGASALGIVAYMELRFALHEEIAKSQIELLTAVERSEIKTFGWPIGVTLQREEYRPRPHVDGIKAEISINKDTPSGRVSYDYWAARNSGDFFLLQSLFEDQRVENSIFFNTRIVRITEALLFASNFYTELGVSGETKLSIRVSHHGFRGRILSTSGTRFMSPDHFSQEDESHVEIVVTLGEIREKLVEYVRSIAGPLFMLFDFQVFPDEIYTDIVRRFEKGEVS